MRVLILIALFVTLVAIVSAHEGHSHKADVEDTIRALLQNNKVMVFSKSYCPYVYLWLLSDC